MERALSVLGDDVLPAQFRQLPPVGGEIGGWGRGLTPMNAPIPVTEGFLPPRWDAIPPHTPVDEIRSVLDQNGKLLYKAVSTSYVIRSLYALFPSGWGVETIQAGWVDEERKPGEDGEYRVAIQIVAPGLFRPVMGVGSNKFQKRNAQDTDAKTIAAAYTAALKNAAKVLNIGRDFDEDDPEVMKVVDDRRAAIQTFITALTEKGKGDAVQAIIRKEAPTALLESGEILVGSVDFDRLETVQRQLQELAIATPKAAATTK